MSLTWPIRPYHFQADQIWLDGLFKWTLARDIWTGIFFLHGTTLTKTRIAKWRYFSEIRGDIRKVVWFCAMKPVGELHSVPCVFTELHGVTLRGIKPFTETHSEAWNLAECRWWIFIWEKPPRPCPCSCSQNIKMNVNINMKIRWKMAVYMNMI
jgi:hypothetical protein